MLKSVSKLVIFNWLFISNAYLTFPRIFSLRHVQSSPLRFAENLILKTQVLVKNLSMTQTDINVIPQAKKEYSFVQDDMRPYAMKLHTRDQAPKEGQKPAQKPFTQWIPSRLNYLQFLVDSLIVYEALEEIVHLYPVLEPLRKTGLERSEALKKDIQWMLQFDASIKEVPKSSDNGMAYAVFLRKMAKENMPKFICHYYNHYFAHTAGGRMIGKRMSDQLLDGETLNFYKWETEDVKELLNQARIKIDVIANSWTPEEKQDCLEETLACFKYGGSLLTPLNPPAN
eukprot:gene4306-6102_t